MAMSEVLRSSPMALTLMTSTPSKAFRRRNWAPGLDGLDSVEGGGRRTTYALRRIELLNPIGRSQ